MQRHIYIYTYVHTNLRIYYIYICTHTSHRHKRTSESSETYLRTSWTPTTAHPFPSAPHYMLHLFIQMQPTFPSFFQENCLYFPSLRVVEEADQDMEVVGRACKSVCHCYCSICILDVVYFRGLIQVSVIQPSDFGSRLSCCWANCSEEILRQQVSIIFHC